MASHGRPGHTAAERRTAEVGEKLYEIGDAIYPFIAIEEGEVALLDGAGEEVVRHGTAGFLGEVNLLSGQTVFLTAEVTKPLRYIAVERQELREEDLAPDVEWRHRELCSEDPVEDQHTGRDREHGEQHDRQV